MDLIQAKKSAHRFHAATVALASRAMGLEEEKVISENYSLPLIVQEGGMLFVLNLGTKSQDDNFIAPYVVNGAFSLELHLKLLNFIEKGEWPSIHELDKLFSRLPQTIQEAINDDVVASLDESVFLQTALSRLEDKGVQLGWGADELLKKSNRAFVSWRYAFEKIPGCFAGYSELQAALKNQIRLAELGS